MVDDWENVLISTLVGYQIADVEVVYEDGPRIKIHLKNGEEQALISTLYETSTVKRWKGSE